MMPRALFPGLRDLGLRMGIIDDTARIFNCPAVSASQGDDPHPHRVNSA
jgi:hypothetical protein